MDLQDSNVQTPLSSEVDIIVPKKESNEDPLNFTFFDVILFHHSHRIASILPYSSSWISNKGSQQGSFL